MGTTPPQIPRVYLLSQGCDQNNNNNNNSKQEVMEQKYWRWLNKINKWKQNSCNQPKGKLWSEFLISEVPEVLGWGTAQQCPHFVWLMLSNDAYRVGLHITVSVHLDDHVLFVQHCCAWIFIMSVCNKLSYRLPHWSLSPVDHQLFSFSVHPSSEPLRSLTFSSSYWAKGLHTEFTHWNRYSAWNTIDLQYIHVYMY